MAVLRRQFDLRRRNETIQLRCISGNFLFSILCIFLSFLHFILTQLLLHLATKASSVLFSALFHVYSPYSPSPSSSSPSSSSSSSSSSSFSNSCSISTTPGAWSATTCYLPRQRSPRKEFRSDFITLSAHLVGDNHAILGTAGSHVAHTVHHFQEHGGATNDGQELISEVWWTLAQSDAPASP